MEEKIMKAKMIISSICGLALATGIYFSAQANNQAELQARAKLSQADAEKIALGRVAGQVTEAELEEEKGKVIWSIEVTTSETSVSDVEIDANTGDILEVEAENAADEKAEDDTSGEDENGQNDQK